MDQKIAIVILNYNGKSFLEKFLPGIIEHKPFDASIYIADNNSSDESYSYIVQNFPLLNVIRLDKNYGFAGGYNEALKQIKATYYVLLNSDVEVCEDWVSPIINQMDKDDSIAAAQPKILNFNQRTEFEYAGACGGFIDILGFPFCRGRVFYTVEKDIGQYDKPLEIFWASGAAKIIRAKIYHQAGGFDEDFFAHMEEIDLCYRIKRMGYRIMAFPEVSVYHVGGGTLSYNDPRKLMLNFRNSIFMLVKNSSINKLIWALPLRMFLDGLAALNYLRKGNTGGFKAVLNSHVAFYRQWNKLFNKRATTAKKIPITLKNKTGILVGILPFHYFILGNKRFYSLSFKLFPGKI